MCVFLPAESHGQVETWKDCILASWPGLTSFPHHGGGIRKRGGEEGRKDGQTIQWSEDVCSGDIWCKITHLSSSGWTCCVWRVHKRKNNKQYQQSFDLLTLKALELRATHTHRTSHSMYQQKFGHQAHIYHQCFHNCCYTHIIVLYFYLCGDSWT